MNSFFSEVLKTQQQTATQANWCMYLKVKKKKNFPSGVDGDLNRGCIWLDIGLTHQLTDNSKDLPVAYCWSVAVAHLLSSDPSEWSYKGYGIIHKQMENFRSWG